VFSDYRYLIRSSAMTENAQENEQVMKAAYDDYYDQIVEHGFRHHNIAYVLGKANSDWQLLSRLDLKDKRILNIACAEPIDELFWAGYPFKEWVAVDLNEKCIRTAEKIVDQEMAPQFRHKFKFQVADARKLPFEDASFDIVVSFHAIDHVPSHEDRQAFLDEMARVVKPGGHTIVTTTNVKGLFLHEHNKTLASGKTPPYGYAYFFSRKELEGMIRKTGLEPVAFNSEIAVHYFYPRRIYRMLNRYLENLGDRIGYLSQKPAAKS
jgi:ubiquinone/menaquinone biosynthesis C-methylase UbiE